MVQNSFLCIAQKHIDEVQEDQKGSLIPHRLTGKQENINVRQRAIIRVAHGLYGPSILEDHTEARQPELHRQGANEEKKTYCLKFNAPDCGLL